MNKLKDFLKRERYSGAAFGRLFNIDKSFVHRIMNGERFPSSQLAYEIEEFTKGEVTAESLINPEGKEVATCPHCHQKLHKKKFSEMLKKKKPKK